MSLLGLLPVEATVVRYTEGAASRYGDPTRVWADTDTYPARLTQVSTEERQDRAIAEWNLYLPADADITAADRVTVDGATYEVIGEPYRPRGRRDVHHVKAHVRRVA